MKYYLPALLLITLVGCQSISYKRYSEEILLHRTSYQNEFLHTDRSPLEKEDLQFLDFYPPDRKFCVKAGVTMIEQRDTLLFKTSSGKFKKYLPFALLTFYIDTTRFQLVAYTSPDLMNNEQYADYLFVPFSDETNDDETYGGGRYLDLNKNEISKNHILVDFNKAYNPWCAFSYGYNCPIPPNSNDLPVKIEAGEKKFRAPVKKK